MDCEFPSLVAEKLWVYRAETAVGLLGGASARLGSPAIAYILRDVAGKPKNKSFACGNASRRICAEGRFLDSARAELLVALEHARSEFEHGVSVVLSSVIEKINDAVHWCYILSVKRFRFPATWMRLCQAFRSSVRGAFSQLNCLVHLH